MPTKTTPASLQPVLAATLAPLEKLTKLTQANLDLLTRFSHSDEISNPSQLPNLLQSKAFNELSQGIIKNYSEFVSELGKDGMAALAKAQP
jgi:hypothetical protein